MHIIIEWKRFGRELWRSLTLTQFRVNQNRLVTSVSTQVLDTSKDGALYEQPVPVFNQQKNFF